MSPATDQDWCRITGSWHTPKVLCDWSNLQPRGLWAKYLLLALLLRLSLHTAGLILGYFFLPSSRSSTCGKKHGACPEFFCARQSPRISKFLSDFYGLCVNWQSIAYLCFVQLRGVMLDVFPDLLRWDSQSKFLSASYSEWVPSSCSSAAENTEKKIPCQNLWELSLGILQSSAYMGFVVS